MMNDSHLISRISLIQDGSQSWSVLANNNNKIQSILDIEPNISGTVAESDL